MRKWECDVCGFVHKGDDPPEKCPVCDSPAKMFTLMTGEQKDSGETETAQGKRWRCTVCGYIHTGDEPPEKCPVCAAPKNMFVEIDREGKALGEPASVEIEEIAVPPGEKNGKTAPSFFDRLGDLVLKQHLHHISVHFPNGVLPVVVVFLCLYAVFNTVSLEAAAFYNLIFVLVILPFVLLTGFIEWQKRYKGLKTAIFFTKIVCGLVVLAAVNVLVFWRILDPGVMSAESSSRLIYLGIAGATLGVAGLAGYLGGKLVFGARGLK